MTDDNFEHIGHFLINLTRLLLIECVLQIKTIIIIIVFFFTAGYSTRLAGDATSLGSYFGAGRRPGAIVDTENIVLPHHKLKNVVRQPDLIKRMREMKTGEFVYLAYAVSRSSEHYTPYALTYVCFILKTVYLTVGDKNFMM